MANLRFSKGAKIQLTRNFNSSEFDCSCNNCWETIINTQLVQLLQHLRDKWNSPIIINSAYRCAQHNQAIGGAKNSQHPLGNAADIGVTGVHPDDVAEYAEKIFAGVGRYDTFTHVDVRGAGIARWDFRKKS